MLKPGGRIVLEDIRHKAEYAAILRGCGLAGTVQCGMSDRLWTVLSFGGIRPFRLFAG